MHIHIFSLHFSHEINNFFPSKRNQNKPQTFLLKKPLIPKKLPHNLNPPTKTTQPIHHPPILTHNLQQIITHNPPDRQIEIIIQLRIIKNK